MRHNQMEIAVKKFILITTMLTISFSVTAQLLPVLGTVGATNPEDASLTVGTISHAGDSGVSVYGVRGAFCPIEDLLLMGDLALTRTASTNKAVYAPGVGVAAQFSLAQVESLPLDFALRVGYSIYNVADLPVNSSCINAMLLISGESDAIRGLAGYGGVGTAYWLEKGLDVSILANIGLRYKFPEDEQLSIYGEATYVSGNVSMDAGLGFGLAYAF